MKLWSDSESNESPNKINTNYTNKGTSQSNCWKPVKAKIFKVARGGGKRKNPAFHKMHTTHQNHILQITYDPCLQVWHTKMVELIIYVSINNRLYLLCETNLVLHETQEWPGNCSESEDTWMLFPEHIYHQQTIL